MEHLTAALGVALAPHAMRAALHAWRALEQQRLDLEIANGWEIDAAVTASTLRAEDRARFALGEPDAAYRQVDVSDCAWHGIVPGSEAYPARPPLSPWAVWTTARLLTLAECRRWIERADSMRLERGDFIFKTGRGGFERMPTGMRRLSQTCLVEDADFAALIEGRLYSAGGVPETLSDGRSFRGVRPSFLVTKYETAEYFAPHFDGCSVVRDDTAHCALHGCVGAFTCVLYLSEDFEGGATHYLAGQGSEVAQPVAVRPKPGCAVVHRTVTVLHAGGRLERGHKWIMQFALCYDAPEDDSVKPLRWGA
ncbi:hypothetical protein KFE25_000181 [Diacronema lutheri]|uniref:Fe2OG dioxygenase domain-containing protein n=1 Tax=Diacronema lutheri TaxID=2081491 RepID=A0A8J5XCD0_DIALT|nr:hypothetical protein KFE25_000181 [Diacronema lutheri]